MPLKAAKGLTAKGLRKGRPPKHLTAAQLAKPLPLQAPPEQPRYRRSETRLIVLKEIIKARLGTSNLFAIAYEIAAESSGRKPEVYEVDAIVARLKRIGTKGVDLMPEAKKRGQPVSISQKR